MTPVSIFHMASTTYFNENPAFPMLDLQADPSSLRVQEQVQSAARSKTSVEPPAKAARAKAPSAPEDAPSEAPTPLSNGSSSRHTLPSVNVSSTGQQPREDRSDSKRRPTAGDSAGDRGTAASTPKRKQAGAKPAAAPPADLPPPRSSPAQPPAADKAALQNGAGKRAEQAAPQAPPAAKGPTPRNGMHPKAAGVAPPKPTQAPLAESAAAPAVNSNGQRRGPGKAGKPSSNPVASSQPSGPRRGAPDAPSPDADRPTPASSIRSQLANGSRAVPSSKLGAGAGVTPGKGVEKQPAGDTSGSGSAPAQNPWQIRAQQRDAMVQSMQKMRLESSGRGSAPSAWPALGTSPGGTTLPTEDPTHPLQPRAIQNGPLRHFEGGASPAGQSRGYPHGVSSNEWVTEGLLQHMSLDGGQNNGLQLPNGSLQSPTAHPRHPLQQSDTLGWQPLLGKAGFDWSLGMASDGPLGGSFSDRGEGSRAEGGFSSLAAPLVPALDESSLQQHPPATHGLLASQLSSSAGSGGLLREASAARPVPLSPLRPSAAAHGHSETPRGHSSLGSSDLVGSGSLRSPGSMIGPDARLLGQSGSPLRPSSQSHSSLVGSILGPANGQQPAQAMPACIRQIWERGSDAFGGSGPSGADAQAPRLDPRLASPIMEPSMWQPQMPQADRHHLGQTSGLRAYSHASR